MKTLSSKVVYKTKWFTFYVDEVEFGSGVIQPYGYVKRPDGVYVAVVNDKDEILLVRQYRYPIKRLQWEVPGGAISLEESLQESAVRELKEETGVEVEVVKLEHLGQWYTSSSLTTEKLDLFWVRVFSEVIITGHHGDADEEISETKFISFSKALKMIDSGEIDDIISAHIIQLVARRLKN